MTTLVAEPRAKGPAEFTAPTEPVSLDAIGAKLDALMRNMETLNARVDWLAEQAWEQQRRRREWDELGEDLAPIVREAYAVAVEEMQSLQTHVQLDDILMLIKRLAANTRNLNLMLDWLESAIDLTHDANRMGREMMTAATESLSALEHKGYFGFIRQGQYVLDQIVTSFSEEEVRQLGDNVVLILNTVKALTQPQMMTLLNNLTTGFHEADAAVSDADIRFSSLLRQMRDPNVRRGLAVTLATLKTVASRKDAAA